MRLIDVDKLIHALANEYITGKKTLGQVIDEQPSPDAGKWVPVNKRLPENDPTAEELTGVLVSLDTGAVAYGFYDNQYETWYSTVGDAKETHITYGVLAWMPLPEAYKEDCP